MHIFFAKIAILGIITGLASSVANAGETVTYTYDELGRLVSVSSAGSVNSGQTVAVTFDAAGNRMNYTVSGALSNGSPDDGAALPAPQPRYFFNGRFFVTF